MKTRNVMVLSVVMGLFTGASVLADMRVKNLSSKISMTGGLVGNGGGTVVCRNAKNEIQNIQLLDYYESRIHPGMTIDIQKIDGNWKKKASAIIKRVRAKSDFRFQLYSEWLKRFEKERMLMEGVEFSTVPDSGYISVPKGCMFEQAAIQRKPIFTGDSRYFINAELWNAMDDSQKAGLVLHEIIYREAIAYGHTDSIRTRYLTGLYSSTQFKDQENAKYWKTLAQAHFELTDIKVVPELYGTIKSKVSLSRLWQAAPDEFDAPGSLELQNQYFVSVGKCSGEGCSNFETKLTSDSVSIPDRMVSISLPADLLEMWIGDSQLSLKTLEVEDGVAQVLSANAVWLIQNSSGIFLGKSGVTGFSLVNSQGRSASGVSSLALSLSSDKVWKWKRLRSKSYGENLFGERPLFLPVVQVEGKCVEAKVLFENDLPVSVGSERNGNCIEDSSKESVTVLSAFENGVSTFSILPGVGGVEYDPNHFGRPLKPATEFNSWAVFGFQVICENRKINCIHLEFNSSQVVTKVKIVDSGSIAMIGCKSASPSEACFMPQVPVQSASELELYPNGIAKSFVVGVNGGVIRINGKSVNVKPGMTIELDSEGFPVSVH